jgi:hypothetical protein
MNTGLLNSFASMVKGSMIVTDAIKTAFTKFADEAPTDDQVLVGISEAVFTITLNKDARQVLSFYLIQLYANYLFVLEPHLAGDSFDSYMITARTQVNALLSFNSLDRIAKYVWQHREAFIILWAVYAENVEVHPESNADILAATLSKSIQLLEAA